MVCRHLKFVNQQGEGKSEPLDNTPSLSLCMCMYGEKIKITTNKHGLVKITDKELGVR